jgi:hypothetical protein
MQSDDPKMLGIKVGVRARDRRARGSGPGISS